VLFRSGVKCGAPAVVAAILTGMGQDGAEGMAELRRAGATTLGQNEETSLIYGMPRVAFEKGGVMSQHPLTQIADAILRACEGAAKASAHG
jgi:two-component system chemotaxis response regulator CheB